MSSDIFAFGLCMLELLTLKQLDPQHCGDVQQLLQQVRVSNTGTCSGHTHMGVVAMPVNADSTQQMGCALMHKCSS